MSKKANKISKKRLRIEDVVILYSLNGANPINANELKRQFSKIGYNDDLAEEDIVWIRDLLDKTGVRHDFDNKMDYWVFKKEDIEVLSFVAWLVNNETLRKDIIIKFELSGKTKEEIFQIMQTLQQMLS